MHLSRGRLQTGCKQGARTPPARYSGCILGANRVHANSECDSATLVLVNSKNTKPREDRAAKQRSQTAISLPTELLLFLTKREQKKVDGLAKLVRKGNDGRRRFPPRTQKSCSENPSATPLVLEVSETESDLYRMGIAQMRGLPDDDRYHFF